MRAVGSSIRQRLVLLALAAALPLLVFSGVLVHHAYQVSAQLIEDSALGYARRLALAVDAQLGRAQAVGLALAELAATALTEVPAFERTATRALEAASLEGTLLLLDRAGRVVAHTRRGLDEPAPAAADVATARRVFETGRPQISGPVGPASNAEIAIHLPATREGRVEYDAVLALSAQSIARSLAPYVLPAGWSALMADGAGRIIARNPGAPAGEPISPTLAALASRRAEGFGSASTVSGQPVLIGFTHSEETGWLIGVAVPGETVLGPQIRSIAALALGGTLLVLLSLWLAWRIGLSIARPVAALAEQAARLGSGHLPDPAGARGLAEADAAGSALYEAAQNLRERDAEREAALRRAEESEARLLLAQEVGGIGVWETDIATRRRTWSQQQFALYGRDPALGAPQGDGWLALVHPEDRDAAQATVARAYAEPTSYQHEFRVLHSGGTIRWLRSAGRSLFRNGEPSRLIGTSMDVTDRHEAERALRESAARLEAEVAARTRELAASEQRFRTYFEYSAETMVAVRVDGDRFTFETINKAGERLTGLSERDIAGKQPDEVLLPETAAQAVDAYRRVAASAAPIRLERSVTVPAGRLELESILVPVRDPTSGSVVRILSRHRDLTEQKRIESRLAHAQRLEAVGQLTGGVAHDFNNLLTVVVGNLSLLRRRLGDDERALRYLGSVEAAAERGAKLTANLLAFSRRSPLQVTPLNVGAQIQDSITLLQRAVGEDIAFSLDVQPGLRLANADPAQLDAAVVNLVMNARDAIGEAEAKREQRSGRIRVSVHEAVLLPADLEGNEEARPGRFIAIEVRDNGAGMTPAVRVRAFEPFFTTKEVGRGTGLGLSQVFGFVRQLGGHVVLDSTPQQGTRVVLYLPVTRAGGAVAEPEAHRSAVTVPQGAVVLVVEDDDGIRDVTSEVLRDSGLQVITAANGPSALEVLRGPTRVDALFSDVVLPGGASGVELARAAHTFRPSLPVLLTSGYGGPALSRYAADGDYEVLAKPYTRAVLLERIGQMLADLPTALTNFP